MLNKTIHQSPRTRIVGFVLAATVAFFLVPGTRKSASAIRMDEAEAGQRRTVNETDSAFEAAQTEKILGVPVRDFPAPQGLKGFDELPTNAPSFRFTVTERPLSGPNPRRFFENRKIVEASAPDGTLYEAYSGRDNSGDYQVAPGHGFVSTIDNRRQRYGTHYGYAFQPEDVFIGQRIAGRLKPTLFFRDVGSHTTAPHHLAIDNRGLAHLTIADVNISQGNRLDFYWVIGNPISGKWQAAWLIDRRGFTSWASPWSAAYGDKVHLLWDWCDVSVNKRAPGMGLFHVPWSASGFGRKVRIASGVVREWDAAIDRQSGRLLIVFAKPDGVYVTSQTHGGMWTRATRLRSGLARAYEYEVSVEASQGGTFIIRVGAEDTREWVLRPAQ